MSIIGSAATRPESGLSELLSALAPEDQQYRRGTQFERVVQWFLQHDPTYASMLRRVWLWNEWPHRMGRDIGIDLVAEDFEGRSWAIQAKSHARDHWITKAEIDSFLSASARPEFAFRLLVATTDHIGPNARATMAAQEKRVSRVLRSDLESAAVIWPKTIDDLSAPKPEPKTPLLYQSEAVAHTVKGFETSDRGQLLMACGTGKTLASLFIAEDLGARRTLVLLPSLSLLEQTLREWSVNATDRFVPLAVCSDESVAGADAPVTTPADLGFPVTTDPEHIAHFLRRRTERLVIFSTYQSSPRIAQAYRLGRVPRLDLAIADEAHRCAGPVSSQFATILDGTAIPSRRRLFMTATPRYFTGRVVREAREADFEVASMGDESVFGPVFHRLSFSEAINRELLCDYQVAVIGVDDDTYKEYAEGGRFVTTDGKTVVDARTLATQVGLAKAARAFGLQRVISFHSRVASAKRFASSLTSVIDWMPRGQRPRALQIWADHVSGTMSAGERRTKLDRLGQVGEGELGFLTNARCLSEGVDVPTLDGVAFIEPKRSEVDIVQAVGRAIRKAPDKKIGTIIVPVFVGTSDESEAVLNGSAFKPVWDVIKALRAHDDDLAAELDEIRRQLGEGLAEVRLPAKIHVDLPARVGLDFARAFGVRLIENTTSSWEFGFGVLRGYVDRHGTASVHPDHREGAFRLGGWVVKQRGTYAAARLGGDKTARLEALPGWTWAPRLDWWEQAYSALEQFVALSGHAVVPRDAVVNGVRLGAWVLTQRQMYRQGKIDAERVRRLEALPGWSWDVRGDGWERRYEILCRYVAERGDARVPARTVFEGEEIGSWVSEQRAHSVAGRLSPDQVHRLDALRGWSWAPRNDDWEEGFAALTQHVAETGTARVAPEGQGHGRCRLETWTQSQRRARAAGILSAEQIRRLEALPGWSWTPRTDDWHRAFEALRVFERREAHANVPQQWLEGGFRLGGWVSTQRSLYARGQLSADRIQLLEALIGWSWNANLSVGPRVGKAQQWENTFALLLRFVEREGHARVPSTWVEDGRPLGKWVSKQRANFEAGQLEGHRATRLASLPGWSWDPHADLWEEGYAALVTYAEREGHAAVPQDHCEGTFNLGTWVSRRRSERRRGTLTEGRAQRLESLPGWVWRLEGSPALNFRGPRRPDSSPGMA